MSVQGVQQRFPWIMTPFVWLDALLTPRRWACGLDRGARAVSNALTVDTSGLARVLNRGFAGLSRWRIRALSRSSFLMWADWRLRRLYWAMTWGIVVFARLWPRRPPVPREEGVIRLISAPESYPDFQSPLLVVPADVPCAEQTLQGAISVQILHLMQDIYPIVSAPQPAASTDPRERLREAYPFAYRLIRKGPVWHPDLVDAEKRGTLLGVLAAGGPFAKLLELKEGGAGFEIDLRHLNAFPVREGLARLGCLISFVERSGDLHPSCVEYLDKTVKPGDSNWPFMERIALCSLLTHTTVWRHGMQYHVAGVAPLAPVTHNLPPAHPLRRLLAPHIAETLSTNFHTHLTLRRSGFDVTGFSFSYETILRYYNEGARTFNLSRLDPRVDLQRKGLPKTLTFPYRDQALLYFSLFESYVSRYVDHHYATDADLQADVNAKIWFDALDHYIVGGIRGYAPELTIENLIRLCALFIYTVTVEHEENSMWNYAVFLPATVHADGSPQTVGEVQSVMNFQLVISSATNKLMRDFSYLALDAESAAIGRDFHDALRKVQRQMESEPDRYWRIYPADLEASVSA